MFTEKVIAGTKSRVLSSGFFPSSTGKEKIYFKRNYPSNPDGEKGIHLLMIHSATEYHGRMQLVADYMLKHFKNKLFITWIDLKGHGLSNGTRVYCRSFREYSDDVIELINLLYRNVLNVNVKNIVVGHGMGGLIPLLIQQHFGYSLEKKIDGQVLVSPFIKLRVLEGLNKYIFRTPFLKKLGKFRVPKNYDGHDLSGDENLASEYNSDLMIPKFYTVNLMEEIMEYSRDVRSFSYFIDIPTLLMTGENDTLVDVDVVRLFHKGITQDFSTYKNFDGQGHDLLNEKERDKHFRYIYTWIKKNYSL